MGCSSTHSTSDTTIRLIHWHCYHSCVFQVTNTQSDLPFVTYHYEELPPCVYTRHIPCTNEASKHLKLYQATLQLVESAFIPALLLCALFALFAPQCHVFLCLGPALYPFLPPSHLHALFPPCKTTPFPSHTTPGHITSLNRFSFTQLQRCCGKDGNCKDAVPLTFQCEVI